MMESFRDYLAESRAGLDSLYELEEKLEKAIELLVSAIRTGKKVMICGNGGSAADSQHMATEHVCRFEKNREPIAAIALTTDTSLLTATSNDFSFDDIFSRQVEALGREGDILIAISTSGNSDNVIKAVSVARSMGIDVIGMTGETGDRMAELCDVLLNAPSRRTAIVQQLHQVLYHFICGALENSL